jgi:hypothetical protein
MCVFLPALMACAWAMAATVSAAASYVWVWDAPFVWSTVKCQSFSSWFQDIQVIKGLLMLPFEDMVISLMDMLLSLL